MNEQYVYNCYKFILKSNIPLSFLPKCNENFFMSDCIIDLSCYNEKTFDNEKIYCTKNNKDYIIESPLTSYVIDVENNRIKAYYKNKNELESTLYNLPFSILAHNCKDILLHASSIECNKKIIAFCADKGVGKTTFVSHLTKFTNVFSDDTLYLTRTNNIISCFSNSMPLKMNFSTFKSLSNEDNIFVTAKESLQGKKFIESRCLNLGFGNISGIFNLKCIFFLRRVRNKSGIEVKNIDNELQKKSLLLNNVVGISYLLPEHVKNILNSSLFIYIIQNIPFKYLDICDDLFCIHQCSEKFYYYILNEVV